MDMPALQHKVVLDMDKKRTQLTDSSRTKPAACMDKTSDAIHILALPVESVRMAQDRMYVYMMEIVRN